MSIIVVQTGTYFLYIFKKNLNASRPSEHPPVKRENVKTLRWIHIGCRYKTSTWHFNGFPHGSCSVDLKPGDCELVVDGGRALQPCRYRLFTHMSCIILHPYSTYPCRGYTHVIHRTLDTLLVYRLTVGTVT